MKFGWYVQRLRRMSAAEMAARVQVAARQRLWANPARRPDGLRTLLPGLHAATVALPRPPHESSSQAAQAAIAAAERLLTGSWPIFHLPDVRVGEVPDWFHDPLTGRTAPRDGYAFDVPYRDESKVGNIKFVWEMSRHQATTLLAAAYWLTGDDRFAVRAAQHLRAWWADNPFMTGVHWVSAIEVGLRLLSWTWIRALLAEWPGAAALFDGNPTFQVQLYHHCVYVKTFHSNGSSANNHFIAELAGLSAACVAFPWFRESRSWGHWATAELVRQADIQTHEDGFNREQASEYHLFVFEMLLAARLPARWANRPFPPATDTALLRMADALAASLDATGQMPRFGDGDNGRGVVVDAPQHDHGAALLDAAAALYGPAAWWPIPGGSVLGLIAAQGTVPAAPRMDRPRPDTFPGLGMTLLRAGAGRSEIWVRCDAGPHGFLSIAAHGHADALSIELRCGGVEVLADPGTYCYHGEPEWRGYFKGTPGHNTLTVDGRDQAESRGPFLWLNKPNTILDGTELFGPTLSWQARHDGYQALPDPVTHHRRVELDRAASRLLVTDWIDAAAGHEVSLAWHLGPAVEASLDGATATLRWDGGQATAALTPELRWSLHRGEEAPPLGWYSRGFGHKMPSWVLIGSGPLAAGPRLTTRFDLTLRDGD